MQRVTNIWNTLSGRVTVGRSSSGFSGGGWGKGASGNSRSFLNKRNLRRLGEIMRNANLPQSFSLSLWLFLSCSHISSSWDPERPLETSVLLRVSSTPTWGLRRALELSPLGLRESSLNLRTLRTGRVFELDLPWGCLPFIQEH